MNNSYYINNFNELKVSFINDIKINIHKSILLAYQQKSLVSQNNIPNNLGAANRWPRTSGTF